MVDLLAPDVHRFKGPLRNRRIGTAGTVSVLWHGLLGAARAYQANLSAISLVRDTIQRSLELIKS